MNLTRRQLALLVATIAVNCAALAAQTQTPAPTVVIAADNAFGFRLLGAVQKASPGANVVVSPVSAALDLSMVLDGAEGETRQQMLSALSLEGAQPGSIHEANALLIKTLRTPAQNVTLSVADSLWADSRHVTLRPEYLQQTQSWSDAKLFALDFSDPGVATLINGWVAKETQGRISKIVGRIEPSDRLLLLNAIYFKGQWAQKFDKAQTQPKNFSLEGGAVKQVQRMTQSGRFEYLQTPQFQAIRLPFGDGDLGMLILLPAQSSSLGALQAQLTWKQWQDWRTQMHTRSGAIAVPRFELKTKSLLNGALQSLGMKRAFGKDAQFSGMFSAAGPEEAREHFFISSVLQSTFWKVDEEGAEAAAVTSTRMRATVSAYEMAPFQMTVDRPFFCAIEDRRNGALLFIGAIHDPTTG